MNRRAFRGRNRTGHGIASAISTFKRSICNLVHNARRNRLAFRRSGRGSRNFHATIHVATWPNNRARLHVPRDDSMRSPMTETLKTKPSIAPCAFLYVALGQIQESGQVKVPRFHRERNISSAIEINVPAARTCNGKYLLARISLTVRLQSLGNFNVSF